MTSLLNLFAAFFRVGVFSLGGGYVLYPLIEKEVVDNYSWLTAEQFAEFTGIFQGIPGAISIKFATLTGYRVSGLPGVLAANLGVILPPALIIIGLVGLLARLQEQAFFTAFLRGVSFATVGLICYFIYTIALSLSWQISGFLLAGAVFLILIVTGIHPGLVIVFAGAAGILIF